MAAKGAPKGRRDDEVELATRMIQIGGKRFNLDVRENKIGRFVKIRESDASGSANKILLPSGGALAFHDALVKFASPSIAKKAAPPPAEDGRAPAIHSETFVFDTKRFHFDLLENSRGRVLKISCVPNSGTRISLMIPAEKEGVEELRAALEGVMKEAGDGMVIASLSSLGVKNQTDGGSVKPGEGDLDLGSKQVQIDTKRFFLDLRQNRIGRFLKVSEVLENGTRQKVTIPAANVGQLRDIVQRIASTEFKDVVLPPGAREDGGGVPPLHSESLKIDSKLMFIDLKSNVRGRLLKISCKGTDTRSSIMVPGKAAHLETFSKALTDMLAMSESSSGSFGAPSEQTLAEATMQVQNKRFFIDLKSNLRGKFLKVTEVMGGGHRNKIIVPGAAVVKFYECIHTFVGKHSRNPGDGKPSGDGDGSTTVHSEMMTVDGKTFYFDLLENSRGRVMKVSQIASDERVSIMLPALGLEGFANGLAGVLRQGGELVLSCTPGDADAEVPGKPGAGNVELASKLVATGGKRFFVDLKENEIGRFAQITEVDGAGKRTKLSMPLSAVGEFQGIIGVFADMDVSALKGQAYTNDEGRPAVLRSELMKIDQKQIHFDLSANTRGAVLKVSMRDPKHGRTTLMIPSTGLKNLRDAFSAVCT